MKIFNTAKSTLAIVTVAFGLGASALPLSSAIAGLTFTTADLTPFGATGGATYTDFGSGGGTISGSFTLSNASGGPISFSGDGAIVSGSVVGAYAQPALASGNYFAVGFNGTSELLSLTGLHDYAGFYWGSIDAYNTVNFYNGQNLVGSLSGGQVATPADGNRVLGATNKYVNIQSDQLFNRIEFVSTAPSFEIDNLALTSAIAPSVPEAATWSMFLLGFAAIGFMGYRRKAGFRFV